MADMKLYGGKKPKSTSMTDIEKAEPSKLESITPAVESKVDNPLQPKMMSLPKGNEADMQKVRDYQTKLNKKGANLVVDGVWGDKTAAASRDYYNKYQKADTNKPKTMNLPKGDTEFKSAKTKLPDTPAAESYFKDKNATSKSKSTYKSPGPGYKALDENWDDTKKKIRIMTSKQPVNTEPGKLSSFINNEGTKSLTIEARRNNMIAENKRVMKLSNADKKKKDSEDMLDNQIKTARESGNTKEFNRLVSLKSKQN